MTREALVEEIASAIHAYMCPCRGADQAPLYYQGAARAALVVIEKERVAVVENAPTTMTGPLDLYPQQVPVPTLRMGDDEVHV